MFFCEGHYPGTVPSIEAPKAAVLESEEVLPDTDQHKKFFGGKKTGRGAPYIDPVWEHASPEKPPHGSDSKMRIECCECHYIHTPKKRKLWNGTYSYCPKCGADVYVPVWNEDEE